MTKNVNEIFNNINKTYNLHLTPNSDEDQKQIETIKRQIRRNLHKLGLQPPYKNINLETEQKLYNPEFKKYLLKQSAKRNPNLSKDNAAFQKMQALSIKDTTTYQEAFNNLAIKYIFQKVLQHSNEFFLEPEFQKAFQEFTTHLDNSGLPLPGYTDSKRNLYNLNNYFIDDKTLNKKKQ